MLQLSQKACVATEGDVLLFSLLSEGGAGTNHSREVVWTEHMEAELRKSLPSVEEREAVVVGTSG